VSLTTITWLERPVPLWPGHSKLMVSGVTSDADPNVIRWWTQLGRSAATPAQPEES
jgi:hypothetical protein